MRPEELRQKVDDLEAALEAIRGGGVDAVIVGPEDHKRVYTLTSADRPYRVIVEEMGEGAATISESTAVLFVNRRLAALLGRDRAELVGTSALGLVGDGDAASLAELLTVVPGQTARCELALCRSDGSSLPALVSVTGLDMPIYPKRRFQHGAVPKATLHHHLPTQEAAYRKQFLSLYL